MSRWKMTRNIKTKKGGLRTNTGPPRKRSLSTASICLHAIKHLARAPGRGGHVECRVGAAERGGTVGRPACAHVRGLKQQESHSQAIIRHVEVDLHLIPGDRRSAAELHRRRYDIGRRDPQEWSPIKITTGDLSVDPQ